MHNNPAELATKIADKFRRSAAMAAKEGILPYKSADDRWITSPFDGNSWWTGGFWPGLKWQLWRATGDDAFRQEALRAEALLTAEFRSFCYLNHDVGFMYLLSCGARQAARRRAGGDGHAARGHPAHGALQPGGLHPRLE